jgi:hypothetical protein
VIALLVLVVLPALGPATTPREEPPAADVAQPGSLPPPPSPTITPSYRDAVYGDVVLAGNSVLRCPVADETTGDNPPEDCAAAAAGGSSSGGSPLDNSGNNNGYYMHLADDDGRGDTFSSSSAEVLVPDGATVRYAQLTWGGHTGSFIGFAGVNCVRPLLLQGESPPPPAAPSPDQQQVRIAVAGAAPVPVVRDPAHFRTTDGLDEPSQIYTDWADVTAAFAGAPTGSPMAVSVANVWAPTGPGCAGGWSITVVFDHGAPHGEYALPRVVDVYNDDLPKTGALLPGLLEPLLPGVPQIIDGLLPGLVPAATGTSVVLPGVTPARSTADVAIGLTAFDGDWRQGGETFTVDGEPVAEPCAGPGPEDFFRSCALGVAAGNNFSVDAKTVRPLLPDNDTGEVEVGVRSTGDFVVLGSVVLAETVAPSVAITMTGPQEPVAQGSLVSYDLQIRNDGGLPLSNVALTADDGVLCTPARLPALAPGATTNVTCLRPAREPGDLTTTATVTGTYLASGASVSATATVSATASVTVTVTPADYTVERVPDRLVVREGATVAFSVVLRNNTTADLTDVVYTDDVSGCAAPAAVLPAGGVLEFGCPATAPATTFESGGTMRGTGPAGEVTVDSDRVVVSVVAPAVAITTTAAKDTLYRGDSVELTFTVTNTGDDQDEALTDLRVTTGDLCTPEPVPALAPGESATVSCVAEPVESQDVVATVTGLDVNGDEVTATAPPVPLTVLEPLIELTQEVDLPTVRAGGEVTITFTVTHVGADADGPVTDVRITSPTLPPSCLPDPVASLAPGETTTATCGATPDRTFDNQAFAAAVDQAQRPMRVGTAPLRVTVINPALTIGATANPESAQHGAEVDVAVTVRNIGDVPMTVEVTNDTARDCDFTLPGEGLRAGAASGITCTVTTPADAAVTELTNTATYTADPLASTGDTGEPLTGADDVTVALLAGDAPPPPPPGTDPVTGDGVSGGSLGGEPGSGGGGRGPGGGGGGSGDDLAWTGAAAALPIGLGVSLLVLGALALMATSHRRHDEDSFLHRWWPGS